MKKRLIPRKYIEKAYKKDISNTELDLNTKPNKEKVHRLPKEMFQILGVVINYIENINKLEGDKDEN